MIVGYCVYLSTAGKVASTMADSKTTTTFTVAVSKEELQRRDRKAERDDAARWV